ncbi:putative bifunctional diguanylate cyclase/phosphodiesterase [Paenibacillus sp.]|uniref:putative bifunctional diguanylate cyclase/phosphodiesterase n=1 Tax=Paenibacillus sp. TaxID=58172 RepID=UPI002D632924|nr:EAL domain-containing protein [Paenibacillus sp.]HZG84125.1 EAL domain-containing protein [Paenibacillus sp.]
MKSRNMPAYLAITLYIALFYTWIAVFRDHEVFLRWGTHVLSITGAGISLFVLYRTFLATRTRTPRDSLFWLLLCLAMGTFIAASFILLWTQLILRIETPFPYVTDYLWVTEYVLLLAALIYRFLLYTRSVVRFVFDILIFMGTAVSLSVHFLIAPILSASELPFRYIVMSLAYPTLDLCLLFVTISLYYLSKLMEDRRALGLILIGFVVQILVDTALTYMLTTNNYATGSFIDPLWLLPPFMMGLAGLHTQRVIRAGASGADRFGPEVLEQGDDKYSVLPYISAAILLVISMIEQNGEIDALEYGTLLVVLLVFVRQIVIMEKGARLVRRLNELVYRDPLTGISNRMFFHRSLQAMIRYARERAGTFAVLVADLDNFKKINDTHGHLVGDKVLVEFADRLRKGAGDSGIASRMGGDEFTLLLPGASRASGVEAARSIIKQLERPFRIDGHELTVTPSIGVSMYPEDGETIEELLKHADFALYLAKEKGKNNVQWFTRELSEAMQRKLELEASLREALEKGEFALFYQPKAAMATRGIVGAEALIRWRRPGIGLVPPMAFIPIAEESDLIERIGCWVIREACRQTKAWQEAGFPPFRMSVNVSVRQFRQERFVDSVAEALSDTGLEPHWLELEITESVVQNLKESFDVLHRLKALGVHVSLDDFGTGYSSLSILRCLPIDTIKIDKSFVDDMAEKAGRAVVKTIIEMADNLELGVVAEGVETEAQAAALESLGCPVAQGYLYGKPMEAAEFEQALKASGSSVERSRGR